MDVRVNSRELSVALVLAMAVVCQAGCSAIIARAGIDLQELRSMTAIEDKFGEPAAVGKEASAEYLFPSNHADVNHSLKVYETRRKIGSGTRATGNVLSFFALFGILEPYNFAQELRLLAKNWVCGVHIAVVYDSSDVVVESFKTRRRSNCITN